MTNHVTSGKIKVAPMLIGLCSALSLMSVSIPANAASTVTGQITQMEFNAGSPSWPQLAAQVNSVNTNYYAQQPSPGCSVPALSADTVKGMQSLLQTAFLAGKNVVLGYNTCNGANYLFDVIVQR